MAEQVYRPVHEGLTAPLQGSLSPSDVGDTPCRLALENADDSRGSKGKAWTPGAGALLLAMALGALYATVLPEMVHDWWDDANYSHGFVVPIFSGFLIWQRRQQIVALMPRGSWIGLPLLLMGLGALLFGDLAGENFLMRSSFIVVLAGLILFHLGREVFAAVAFPVLFLFFMVPLPATLFFAISFPLQNLAARNAAWALDQLGVPVFLDGNVIQLSQISLGVTEACSGVRSLISLLAVGAAWAYLTLPGGWARIALVASVIPITVVANAGRVVVTGLIAQRFGMEYAEGFFHAFSGWIIFLVAFVCLLGVHRLVRFTQSHRHKRAA